jgi:Leu/Phe-tRNA-protein transferase
MWRIGRAPNSIPIYWNILTMHGSINVKSPNNTSKWQMGINSAFKGLILQSFSCDDMATWLSAFMRKLFNHLPGCMVMSQ